LLEKISTAKEGERHIIEKRDRYIIRGHNFLFKDASDEIAIVEGKK
jgi:hypothetical protein